MSAKQQNTTSSSPTTADVTEQLSILRDDLNSITATIAELAQAKGADLSQAAQDRLDAAKASANAGVEHAKLQAVHLNSQANDFVRTQPAAALGIAAGLGFLIGMLSSRK